MLTEIEIEILGLLIQGYNYNEIRKKIKIKKHTTETHIASIYQKLGVCNRVQAVVKYLKLTSKINN